MNIDTIQLIEIGKKAGIIFACFFIAYLVYLCGKFITKRILQSTRFLNGKRVLSYREKRLQTIQLLGSNLIGFVAFVIALLFSLNLFMDAQQLIWLIGLFAAAFGLGARPMVSDYLTGISFLFDDPYDVGEKIELTGGQTIEGVVEDVDLRNTILRTSTGEIYIIPNGEIRSVRNFSRGLYSDCSIFICLPAESLEEGVTLINQSAPELQAMFPDILEVVQVITVEKTLQKEMKLKLVLRTTFGKSAELKPQLLIFYQKQFSKHQIPLA